MTTYSAPTRDMRFVIEDLADLGQINSLPQYEEATDDLVEAVLEEAARRAGRRSLTHQWPEDIHHLGRSRHG